MSHKPGAAKSEKRLGRQEMSHFVTRLTVPSVDPVQTLITMPSAVATRGGTQVFQGAGADALRPAHQSCR